MMKKPLHTADIPSAMLESFVIVLRERPFVTGSFWFGVFAVVFAFSWSIGIVPTLDMDDASADAVVASSEIVNTRGDVLSSYTDGDTPMRIVIDEINLDTHIVIPESRDIEALDRALLDGVVHYPGSADLGELGNVLLFGHSTGFRVVNNEAFKVFNNLKELNENDLIRVQSNSHEYVYRVTSVSLVDADEALVDLSATGRRLTLSTCNSFGAEQERYVVEAELVGEYAL